MDTNEIITSGRGAMSVRRVFADPHVQDGVTVIPAAGSSVGWAPAAANGAAAMRGDGGGFGVIALPVGAFVMKAGRLRWHPAVNANLVIVVAVTLPARRRRPA